MTSGPHDWDDARLEAAFAARAARVPPVPADLVASVNECLPPRAVARRPRAILAAAAAGIVFVVGLGGLALLTVTDRPPVAASPSPSHLRTGPIADAAQELGLTPIGVAQALATYQATPDAREMLVSGYLSNDPGPIRDGGPTVSCDVVDRDSGPLLSPRCSPLLMAEPESIVSRTLTSATVRRPKGPFFSPNFAYAFLPETPEVPLIGEAVPIAITVVGHFHDRRSASCYIGAQAACQSTFVIDRVVEVDGIGVYRAPVLDFGREAAEQALARAVPGLLVVTTVRSGRGDIEDLEPSFIDPSDIPEPIDADVIWVIQAIAVPDGSAAPRSVRTFLVGEGRNVVVEMTAGGPVVQPVPESSSPQPSAPAISGEADFPTTWLGLPVVGVGDVIARQRPDLIDDTAMFVRGWYLAPDPEGDCAGPRGDRGPIEQPCPVGLHWLLEQPEQLWTNPGGPWIDRPPSVQAINPIVLPDVPFDIPNLWFDTGPNPLPVVLLGHLGDSRSGSYPSVEEFVVDALVWRAGDPASALPWLTEPSGEDAASVMARVERDVGPAVGTWLSVVSGSDLAVLHPDAAVELREAQAVWISRALLVEDGRPRVHPFLTADVGRRVWSGMNLLTTMKVEIGDRVGLEVIDGPDEIRAARAGTPDGAAEWVTGIGPPETGEVMLGVIPERPNELRVAWIGRECDLTWRLVWGAGEVFLWPRERLGECPLDLTRREVVLTFDQPVELEAISVSNGGAGG